MPLVRKNSYGTVTVSDKVIVRGIVSAIDGSGCAGDIWLATRRGKLLIEASLLSNAEMANSVSARFDGNGKISLSFCVITRFGAPIKATAELVANELAEIIKERIGAYPSSVKITVTGVRSARIARRNMELEFLYGSED